MQRRWAFWLAILGGWTLLVVVFAVSSSLTYALTYQPPRWRYTFTMAATEWYLWAAFTPLLAWLAERLRPSRARWWRVLALAALGIPVALIKVRLTTALRGIAEGGETYFQITDLAVHYLIYCGIVGSTYGWLHYRASHARELRTSQLEALLAETRLQMLSMQLQPHFLFNTLNTIAELVHQQPAAAERMIAGLSHLLRDTLQAGVIDRVPLAQELSLLDRYVDIQRARFGDRLHFSVSVGDDVRDALVPSLLLQPLVENAIKHGIGAKAGAGTIDVVVARRDARLVIEIIDDGRGVRAGGIQDGVGLSNTRARLQTLYGTTGSLAMANRDAGGAIVTIELPFETRRAGVSG